MMKNGKLTLKYCLWLYTFLVMFSFNANANDGNKGFILIKGGQFNMGDLAGTADEKSELPAHQVNIKKYYLSKNEVTRGQFSEFVKSSGYVTESEMDNPKWKCATGLVNKPISISWKNPGFPQGNNHPVVCISYNDAINYINWLSKKNSKKYRLPTEAEWEYAARAGTKTEYSFGDDANLLCKYGNNAPHPDLTCKDSFEFTSPVGQFKHNAWGLNDMHGNVRELIEDCWNKNYENAPNNGSAWKSGNCKQHVVRGGGWKGYPFVSRSAFRYRTPEGPSSAVNRGFRLAYNE